MFAPTRENSGAAAVKLTLLVCSVMPILGCDTGSGSGPAPSVIRIAQSATLLTTPPPSAPVTWTGNWVISGSNTSGTIAIESTLPTNSPAAIADPSAKSVL